MLTLDCPYCGAKACKIELSLSYEAHDRRFGLSAETFNMWRFKDGQFIDESVAAGVAH